jgi:hypothetical protein
MEPPAKYGVWKSSRHCGPSQGCVEVARLSASTIAVRDSHHTGTNAPVLSLDAREWKRFITMLKKGNAADA